MLVGMVAEVGTTFGALFIGVLISSIFFGVTNLQVYIYFRTYSNDSVWNKSSVCYVWLMDALQLIFSFHSLYWYLVVNYFNPIALLDVFWSFKAQDIIGAITNSSVQILYVIRIWKLDAKVNRGSQMCYILPVINTIFVCAGCAASIVLCYEIMLPQNNVTQGLLNSRWVSYYPLSVWTGVDVVIAASLCYLLASSRTDSRFHSTNTMISSLMLYTVSTGIITSLCSLSSIVAIAVLPRTLVVAAIEFSLTKLYVNSFLALFNARSSLRVRAIAGSGDIVLPTLESSASEGSNDRKPSVPSKFNTPAQYSNSRLSHMAPMDVHVEV